MATVPVEPVLVAELFPRLRFKLIRLLRSLKPEEWALPTACEGWSVKDVALHILGDDLGLLSWQRDGFSELEAPPADWAALVGWINERNAAWVTATRRMSTPLLCDMLHCTGDMVNAFMLSLDPQAEGPPVSWAGDGPAPLWLQIAREFTEYWMHHQHIAEAVNQESALEPECFGPVLDTFCRALPHTYRDTSAKPGTIITLHLTGKVGGTWHLMRGAEEWKLYQTVEGEAACTVSLPSGTAWKLFTKGISPDEASARASITGQADLAKPLWQTVAFIG